METRKEPFLDKPMMLSLLAVFVIVFFILFAGKNESVGKSTDTVITNFKCDSTEISTPKNYTLSFSY